MLSSFDQPTAQQITDLLTYIRTMSAQSTDVPPAKIVYSRYDSAQEPTQLETIRSLISSDLSEPYSIYVYRYFLYQWGNLCYMVYYFLTSRAQEIQSNHLFCCWVGLGWRSDNRSRGFETGGTPGRRDEGLYSDAGSQRAISEPRNRYISYLWSLIFVLNLSI